MGNAFPNQGLGGNLWIVARAPIDRGAAFACDKGWKHARLLSAANDSCYRTASVAQPPA